MLVLDVEEDDGLLWRELNRVDAKTLAREGMELDQSGKRKGVDERAHWNHHDEATVIERRYTPGI